MRLEPRRELWPNGGMKQMFLCLLAALLADVSRAGAKIEGTVALSAMPPPAASARYEARAPVGPPDPPAAIVYLEGTFPEPSTNKPVEVGQRNYQFAPGLIAVLKGSTVTFPNYDDDYHSVFSYSKPKRFDLGKYRKDDKPASQKFEQAGVVKLYCEIHAHMRGTILVLETPHFTKTDKAGKFTLENLPAGNFKLKAWLDEKLVLEKPVQLKDGETLKVDFTGK